MPPCKVNVPLILREFLCVPPFFWPLLSWGKTVSNQHQTFYIQCCQPSGIFPETSRILAHLFKKSGIRKKHVEIQKHQEFQAVKIELSTKETLVGPKH